MTKRHADSDDAPGKPDHTHDSQCYTYAHWCRIHRYPVWYGDAVVHEWYPIQVPVDSGERYKKSDGTEGIRWTEVNVYCGPGAFYPPRGKRGK